MDNLSGKIWIIIGIFLVQTIRALNDLRVDLVAIDADQAVFNSSEQTTAALLPRSACDTLQFQAVEMMESMF